MPRIVAVKNSTMFRIPKKQILPLIFCVAHLLAAVSLFLSNSDSSWGYYYLSLPDAPVVLLLTAFSRVLSYETNWIFLIVLGTMWWYLLGVLFVLIWQNRK